MNSNIHGWLRGHSSIIMRIQRLLDPMLIVGLLVVFAAFYDINFGLKLQLLAITTFLFILPIFKVVGLYQPYRTLSPAIFTFRLLTGWAILLGVLLLIGFLTKNN